MSCRIWNSNEVPLSGEMSEVVRGETVRRASRAVT